MIATILAAGKGTRLMPRTEYVPKTLVPVNGKPMLFYVLDAVIETGIREVIIVVGYKKDVFKSVVGTRYKSLDIEYIDNDQYEVSNNIYSFYLLKDKLFSKKGDILLLESDLVIDVKQLKRVTEMPNGNYSLVSPISSWMNGTTADILADGSIGSYYLKDEQNESGYNGKDKFKTVNVYRLLKDDLEDKIFPAVEKHMEKYGKDDYYEKVFQSLLESKEIILNPYIVDQNSWFEVDSDKDLLDAERIL